MTLHEAMKTVLSSSPGGMTAEQITEIINKEGLYTRSDGKPIPSSQVRARARKYIGMFRVDNGYISL